MWSIFLLRISINVLLVPAYLLGTIFTQIHFFINNKPLLKPQGQLNMIKLHSS